MKYHNLPEYWIDGNLTQSTRQQCDCTSILWGLFWDTHRDALNIYCTYIHAFSSIYTIFVFFHRSEESLQYLGIVLLLLGKSIITTTTTHSTEFKFNADRLLRLPKQCVFFFSLASFFSYVFNNYIIHSYYSFGRSKYLLYCILYHPSLYQLHLSLRNVG